MMDTFVQDIRYAFRSLLKNPSFTILAALALALGIGANTAIFTVVNAVILRPLPYKQAGQLVKVWGKLEKEGIPQNWISEPEWWELRDTNRSFSNIAAYSGDNGANLTRGNGEPLRVSATNATASLFPVLGVQPALGRTFSPDEDQPGRSNVVVLSYEIWKSQFGSDPAVIGRTISLDGQGNTVIGVLPRGFTFGSKADIWTPLALDRTKPNSRGSHYLEVVGRIKPEVSLEQTSQDMTRFAQLLVKEYPQYYRPEKGWGVIVRPLHEETVGDVRTPLLVLLGAVAFVLLIACANVANLLLVRASVREREIAIRAAIGATRMRLIRQLLTESTVLALFGGVLGLVIAYVGTRVLISMSPASLPRVDEIAMDWRVLTFSIGLSIATGIVFGLIPALHSATPHLSESLKEGGRGTSSGTGSHRVRSALVVTEVAVALMLLVGAGLLIRSLRTLMHVDPGFRSDHLLTLRVSLPQEKYKEDPKVIAFYDRLFERLRSLPGVLSVGAISNLPMANSQSSGSVFIEDTSVHVDTRLPATGTPYIETDQRPVSPGYFEALNIPLISGRRLSDSDNANAPLVAVVDEDFANRFWPGQSPIGKRIANSAVPKSNPPQFLWRTIVGVVGHVKNYSLDKKGREQAYFSLAQSARNSMFVAVRTTSDPQSLTESVRREVLAIDPDQPIYDAATMDQLLDDSVAQPRLNSVLLSIFAALALALASIGIYGVMSYLVTLRWHEIGIRMALGAQRSDVLALILKQGVSLVVLGLAIGTIGSLIVTRVLSSLLYGVGAADLLTYTLVPLLLLSVAIIAVSLPARRATRVDPNVALRYE
jgi:putative ABC transport system permease protein